MYLKNFSKQKILFMKSNLITAAVFTLLLFIFGCSSSQMSMYKPSDSSPGWRIDVEKKAGFTDEFICKINDSAVVSSSFPIIGDNFEKQGTYRGKKVVMSGYRTSTNTTEANGNVKSEDKYQIRVFIDDKLVDKFDF